MKRLPIVPGVGFLSDTGQPLSFDVSQVDDALKQAVFKRDDHTCRFCGFKAHQYQDVQFTGKLNMPAPAAKGAKNDKPQSITVTSDDYATACVFCSQCFRLEQISRMQSGTVIWLPEMSQADLNNIARAIFIARISQGAVADMARAAFDTLLRRKEEARKRLGTDNPKVLASILQDFLEEREYAARGKKLEGFAILPLDRRVVRQGDLEFNQFPQILSHWRSKDEPLGAYLPKEWPALFFEVKELAA